MASNLKSNIIVMVLGHRKGLIILNGLGRFRSSRLFRRILVFLLRWASAKVCIQNYADFRFFRRYASVDVSWVCGSGGTVRRVGGESKYLCVTRPDKIVMTAEEILSFNSSVDEPLVVVGCDADDLGRLELSHKKIECAGYVDQKDLFRKGCGFVQIPGYGEGVPHSLVDAICSGMSIKMTRRDFISFGFGQFAMELEGASMWMNLVYDKSQVAPLSCERINQRYFHEFLEAST